MSPEHSRVGIERKILTSILWVGVLPMVLAMAVGYIAARTGRENAVRERLHTSAAITAQALELITQYRLETARNLASNADVVDALRAHKFESDSIEDIETLRKTLAIQARIAKEDPSIVSLYDLQGAALFTTDTKQQPKGLESEWIENLSAPFIASFLYERGPKHLRSLIVTPVREEGSETVLGYLSLNAGVNSLLSLTLGQEFSSQEVDVPGFSQVIYMNPSGISVRVHAREGEGDFLDRLVIDFFPDSTEKTIATMLQGAGTSGNLQVSDFRNAQPQNETGKKGKPKGETVLLAYHKLENIVPEDAELYLIVYTPSSQVFGSINLMAILALVGGILFIAFLCVNAYRDVHNNIVRPISLLNEGAQIVRQGDFDLKLKVGTGDEIEELSNSFNKMAVALKGIVKQLEESEEKYRGVVTSMRDGIYQTDLEGNITFLNPAGVEILGYGKLEDAVGRDMSELFVDETLTFAPWNGDLKDNGAEGPSRLWVHRLDGRQICVEISRNRDTNIAGDVVGVEGAFRDVTESVRLEKEARERSERIAAINQIANVINSSLEAGRLYESLVVELKKFVDCDYAAVAVLSDDGPGFEGRQLWPDHEVGPGYTFTLDAENSCAAWVAKNRKLLLVDNLHEGNSPFADEFPEDIKSCLCQPLYATGRIIGTLNLGRTSAAAFDTQDIDNLEGMAPHLAVAIRNAQLLVNLQLSLEEVTRAQEKLHAANEELKTLDELKTNLLSNVSHELRTPLVAIMGYSDMILNGKAGPINNTQREYLEISLRNIEKLVTLIENLLDFSRLHRGDERLVFDRFDLTDCAKASMQIVKPVADGRKMSLLLDCPPEPIIVEGDKGKMGQVFNNLLSNGVKFNHNGGEVKITLRQTETDVEVEVSDTGIGIPKEAHEKVFKRFYQYDASSTRKYGGTGIGLSISQDIVRLHGSSISVESDEDKGATFRFTLALAHPHRGEGTQTQEPLPLPAETHVLIELVSQDRALGTEVRNVLASEGMDMIHASGAESAAALSQKHSPDCLIVDTEMAGNGRPILDELLQDKAISRLPIVMLSNDDDLYEQYREEVSARIKRSFRKSTLLSGIHHALAGNVEISQESVGNKILCVDNDPEILSFMTVCLEAEGFDVDSCKNGEEALEKLASPEYGLVLLDIFMPGIDGWETCRRIRNDASIGPVKIYMVTAKAIDQHMAKVQESGADGFLLKPFRSADLIRIVQGLEIRGTAQ